MARENKETKRLDKEIAVRRRERAEVSKERVSRANSKGKPGTGLKRRQ